VEISLRGCLALRFEVLDLSSEGTPYPHLAVRTDESLHLGKGIEHRLIPGDVLEPVPGAIRIFKAKLSENLRFLRPRNVFHDAVA